GPLGPVAHRPDTPQAMVLPELLDRHADTATIGVHEDGVHVAVGRIGDVAEGLRAIRLPGSAVFPVGPHRHQPPGPEELLLRCCGLGHVRYDNEVIAILRPGRMRDRSGSPMTTGGVPERLVRATIGLLAEPGPSAT